MELNKNMHCCNVKPFDKIKLSTNKPLNGFDTNNKLRTLALAMLLCKYPHGRVDAPSQ